MPKTEYTQDDYVRALLRSAISTANNRLESILNKLHLKIHTYYHNLLMRH